MQHVSTLLLSILLSTAACTVADDGDITSRDFCEDVPAPGTPGGACFIGFECDPGATCSVHALGFVCAADCSPTAGCDCGSSCSASGLCETQCKGPEDCAEGMVCDSVGEAAPTCVWPALEPLPSVCPEPVECFTTASSFCIATDIAAAKHGVDDAGRTEIGDKCWGHELPMCDICLLAQARCEGSASGEACSELASLCTCYGETLPWF